MRINPVANIEDLKARVNAIAGKPLSVIAEQYNLTLPNNLRQKKGWVGAMIEKALGASAGSLPIEDFPHLGIELKTLPLNDKGEPSESTFIASINLMHLSKETWDGSLVKKKLKHVLWLPIEADKQIPLGQRRVGQGFFWQMNQATEAILKKDWEELVDMLVMGKLAEVNAKLGTYLQVRPKAASGKSLSFAINEYGEKIETLPRGFYLRRLLTKQLLQRT